MFFDAESHKNSMCYIEIPVANLERAKKFYSVVLNIEFSETHEEYAVFYFEHFCVCLISEDSERSAQKVASPGRGALLYFNVKERFSGALKAVDAYKGTIVSEQEEEDGVKRVIICDSEGNMMALYSIL